MERISHTSYGTDGQSEESDSGQAYLYQELYKTKKK